MSGENERRGIVKNGKPPRTPTRVVRTWTKRGNAELAEENSARGGETKKAFKTRDVGCVDISQTEKVLAKKKGGGVRRLS